MKKIKLTKGRHTLVDDLDFEQLGGEKWLCQTTLCGKYAARKEKGKYVYLHRVILGARKGQYVDHKNGDGLDNRRANLRICTNAENGRNRRGLNKNNTSGFRGVCRYKKTARWTAQIMVMHKNIKLGVFSNKKDAHIAYRKASKKHFGDFA